jgi:hypothetical protein
MTQQMPVVRQLQWVGLVPQFVAMAVLAAIACVIVPRSDIPFGILIAMLVYLMFCRMPDHASHICA